MLKVIPCLCCTQVLRFCFCSRKNEQTHYHCHQTTVQNEIHTKFKYLPHITYIHISHIARKTTFGAIFNGNSEQRRMNVSHNAREKENKARQRTTTTERKEHTTTGARMLFLLCAMWKTMKNKVRLSPNTLHICECNEIKIYKPFNPEMVHMKLTTMKRKMSDKMRILLCARARTVSCFPLLLLLLLLCVFFHFISIFHCTLQDVASDVVVCVVFSSSVAAQITERQIDTVHSHDKMFIYHMMMVDSFFRLLTRKSNRSQPTIKHKLTASIRLNFASKSFSGTR